MKTDCLAMVDAAFDAFFPVGARREGGVTRLGYSPVEDEMHAVFVRLAADAGFSVFADEAGNTFASNCPEDVPYTLIESHLDSVVAGGRYDGVAGVVAGLAVLRLLREAGKEIPVRVAAFRCEESAAFTSKFAIGSALVTGRLSREETCTLVSRDGETLAEIFHASGRRIVPGRIAGMQRCLELHIEQGRVLESGGERIGIVSAVAAPHRYRIAITGRADHSGATPMGLRQDALCAAAELILAIERVGQTESAFASVATVGKIENHPNVMNTIPGSVTLGVDTRGVDKASMDRMEIAILAAADGIAAQRNVSIDVATVDSGTPVQLSGPLCDALSATAERMGIPYRRMVSGAGHDCMHFASLCDTALIFIPCENGVSHNPDERAAHEDVALGAELIFRFLTEETAEQ